jgi:CO/xanthine dehydrogenase Mo-binding subunit
MSDEKKSRRPLRCTKRDLMRAIEGVQGRGLEVASVRVEPDGTIHVVTGATQQEAGPPETVSELVKKRMAELTDG